MISIDHDDTILRTFILFVQTAHAALKYADAYFYRKTRLSTVKYTVLQCLAFNNGVMTPSRIAEWTTRERHNITTLVERMRRDGLVDTERSDSDRRFINITITDKGRKILRQATPVAREIVNQMMSSISEGDAVSLEKLLWVLGQNANRSLENVNKHPQTNPGKVITSRPSN